MWLWGKSSSNKNETKEQTNIVTETKPKTDADTTIIKNESVTAPPGIKKIEITKPTLIKKPRW